MICEYITNIVYVHLSLHMEVTIVSFNKWCFCAYQKIIRSSHNLCLCAHLSITSTFLKNSLTVGSTLYRLMKEIMYTFYDGYKHEVEVNTNRKCSSHKIFPTFCIAQKSKVKKMSKYFTEKDVLAAIVLPSNIEKSFLQHCTWEQPLPWYAL